jgi:hypothetical protein
VSKAPSIIVDEVGSSWGWKRSKADIEGVEAAHLHVTELKIRVLADVKKG